MSHSSIRNPRTYLLVNGGMYRTDCAKELTTSFSTRKGRSVTDCRECVWEPAAKHVRISGIPPVASNTLSSWWMWSIAPCKVSTLLGFLLGGTYRNHNKEESQIDLKVETNMSNVLYTLWLRYNGIVKVYLHCAVVVSESGAYTVVLTWYNTTRPTLGQFELFLLIRPARKGVPWGLISY